MIHDPVIPRRRDRRPTLGRGPVRTLVALLIAAVLALLVVLAGTPWALEWGMSRTLVRWLAHPSAGFLPLTLVLWLLFTVPSALRYLGGVRRQEAEGQRASEVADAGPERSEPSGPRTAPSPLRDASPAEEARLAVPTGTFRQLDAGHRWEMAAALGIPWRDELLHDHQSWAVAALEAAQRRAAELRR
jgi:hypothetical protein